MAIPAFYYDKTENACKKFIYGGCNGNGNRYKTKEQCLETCFKPGKLILRNTLCILNFWANKTI